MLHAYGVCDPMALRVLPGCNSCVLSWWPPSQHILTATRWEAQLRGARALQGLLDRFLSSPAQQRCLYFLEASLHHRCLCALAVTLLEEPRGLSFGSSMDTAWGWGE